MKKNLWAALVTVVAFSLASCSSSAGSEKSQTNETKATPTTSVVKTTAKYADTLKAKISVKGLGFDCDWKTDSTNTSKSLGQVDTCEASEILLFTSDSHAAVKQWAKSVSDKSSGWVAVGSKYAAASPNQGTVNRVNDLLGGTAKVSSLG